MEKIRVAVIGQGRSGLNIHGKFFRSEANRYVQVAAVVERLPERREKAKTLFDCDVYSDYTELFSRRDIDLVVNASFSHMHYPITRELLLHGFNVLTEKPFARTWREAQELIRIAREKQLLVTAFHQSLFAPNFQKMKETIRSGILGEISQIDMRYSGFSRRWDWQTLQCFCAGGLYNTGPHPIGQALDLYGWSPEVRVEFSRLGTMLTSGDGDDYAKLILSAPGRHLTDIEINSADAECPYLYKVCGTRGTFVMSGNHYKIRHICPEELTPRPVIRTPLSGADGAPVYCSEKLNWYTEEGDVTGSSFDAAVERFYRMLHDAILEGTPLEVRPEMAAEVIRIEELCHAQNPLPVRFGAEEDEHAYV